MNINCELYQLFRPLGLAIPLWIDAVIAAASAPNVGQKSMWYYNMYCISAFVYLYIGCDLVCQYSQQFWSFLVQDVIYTSRAYAMMLVRLSS